MISKDYTAHPEDGAEILRILESSAAKGSIELIYTRRPDAWVSYQKEPGESRVFVSREDGRIIGTSAELIRSVYIGGEVRRAAYLCGLKKDAAFAGSVGFGVDFLRELRRDDIDFYYCSVVAENRKVRRMFEKPRRILSMKPLTAYKTYIVNPRVRVRAPKRDVLLKQATTADLPALIAFLNREGSRKDLFPVLDPTSLFEGLSAGDFYMLLDGDSIVAAGALWNQTSYKQYIVKRYGGLMKWARGLNPILTALGYIRLPRENEPLDFPILSFLVSLNDDETYYRVFLQRIVKVIEESYGIFVIGLPEGHVGARIFKGLPTIHFETELYAVSFPWSGSSGASVDPRNVYPDCGLL